MTFIGNDDKKKTKSVRTAWDEAREDENALGKIVNLRLSAAAEVSGLPSINKCVQKHLKISQASWKWLVDKLDEDFLDWL